MTPLRITGWHVLFATLAFFGIVIAVNTTMIVYAVGTFSGVDEADAYRKGLAYNDMLDRRAEQAGSGYEATIGLARIAGAAARVSGEVHRHGEPASGVTVSVRLRHPANAALDRSLPLAPAGAARFEADVPDLPAGAWDIVMIVEAGGETVLEARSRLWLP